MLETKENKIKTKRNSQKVLERRSVRNKKRRCPRVLIIIIIIIKPCTLVDILLTSWTSPVIGTLAEETAERVHTSSSVPVRCKIQYKIEIRKCVNKNLRSHRMH